VKEKAPSLRRSSGSWTE